MLAAERAGGLGDLAIGVLNVVGLVEDDGSKLERAVFFEVAAQEGVAGNDEVGLADAGEERRAVRAVDGQGLEVGRELSGLAPPVVYQRGRADHQRGKFFGWVGGGSQVAERLKRFTEAHFVGQDAA